MSNGVGQCVVCGDTYDDETPCRCQGDAGAGTGRLEITLPLPLAPDVWGRLEMPHPLTAAEWDQLMTTLAAMRPGLVREEADDAEDA